MAQEAVGDLTLDRHDQSDLARPADRRAGFNRCEQPEELVKCGTQSPNERIDFIGDSTLVSPAKGIAK